MEYTITPRVPGVRPQDPPDYDGITFVYCFTQVLDPWTQPAVMDNVTIVVANAQGFVPGMTIVVENAGYYTVVSTTALDRMTIQNPGTSWNVPPGTGILPGKVTTTSLPGPPGEAGTDGATGAPGPPLNPKGTVATVGDLPPTGNQVGDLYNVAADNHSYSWDGVRWVDMGLYGGTGEPGPPGETGPEGQPAYTLSVAGFVVPPVGSIVTVMVEDSSWATVGEIVWVQDANAPGVAGPMKITGLTSSSLTLLNIATSTGGAGTGVQEITSAATDYWDYSLVYDSTGVIKALTTNDASLNLVDYGTEIDISVTEFTPTTRGAVPPSGGGTTKFIRADGVWAVPPGGGAVSAQIFGETPTGLIDGVNKTFTASNSYVANTLAVYLNGLRQRRAGDYNETGATTFGFLNAPLPGDSLSIDYTKP